MVRIGSNQPFLQLVSWSNIDDSKATYSSGCRKKLVLWLTGKGFWFELDSFLGQYTYYLVLRILYVRICTTPGLQRTPKHRNNWFTF